MLHRHRDHILHRHRLLVVIRQKLPQIVAVLLVFYGLTYISYSLRSYSNHFDSTEYLFSQIRQITTVLIAGYGAYLLFTMLLAYLQPVEGLSSDFQVADVILARLGDAMARLEGIEKSVDDIGTVKFEVADVDKIELLETLTSAIEKKLNDGAFKSIDDAFARRALQAQHWENLITDFNRIKERLMQETNNLTRRTNVNLALGSLTTVLAGVGLVVIVLLKPLDLTGLPHEEYSWKIVAHYVPRLSLIVFAEVFAFFFLKLYKQDLSDIKYYQNEISNVELKLTALRAALAVQDSDTLRLVITDLSKTERNFVLKQGETTLELEKAKLDVINGKDWINQLASVVKAKTG